MTSVARVQTENWPGSALIPEPLATIKKMTKEGRENIQAFIELMTKLTFRIVSFDNDGKLKGLSSGFLYQPDTAFPPIVVTAGHELPEKGSFIETGSSKNGQTLCLNAGEFNVFYNHDNIDYAYSYLPHKTIEVMNEENESNKGFLVYRHIFKCAESNEAYGFTVWNDYAEFIKNIGNTYFLHRYSCFEIGLELVKQDEHVNYFQTSKPIQDHDYYKGASGSPIADREGVITSILIGGTDSKKYLRATRLDNIDLPSNRP